jgi:hypothetical protein
LAPAELQRHVFRFSRSVFHMNGMDDVKALLEDILFVLCEIEKDLGRWEVKDELYHKKTLGE